jgi:hypothetical protein
MNKKLIFSLIALIIFVTAVVPMVASAQAGAPDKCEIKTNSPVSKYTKADDGIYCGTGNCEFSDKNKDCGLCCLLNSVYTVTDWIFIFLMALSALMIIIGAFNYVTSAGDPGKTEKGRSYIMYAAIGIAVALFAKAIPAIVKMMIGMNA